MGATGPELGPDFPRKTWFSEEGGAKSDATAELATSDWLALREVRDTWPKLSPDDRAAVLAIVRAADVDRTTVEGATRFDGLTGGAERASAMGLPGRSAGRGPIKPLGAPGGTDDACRFLHLIGIREGGDFR